MIRHTLKQIAAVALPQSIQGTASRRSKRNLLGSVLTVSFLVLALGGCVCNKSPVGKIDLYPDAISVIQGQTIVIEAHSSAFDRSDDWNYQWQTILGDDGTDITNANSKELVLKHVGPENGRLYRCAIYRPGDRGETNYTAEVGLQVIAAAITGSGEGTPIDVTGPFQPGTGKSSLQGSCCENCAGFMQMPSTNNPPSPWWVPNPTNATNGVFTLLPIQGKAGLAMVLNYPPPAHTWCNNSNSVTFPVVTNSKFMLIVCFPKVAPPKGTPITYSIAWK